MTNKKNKTKGKVMVALSGGIDSAVSAVLLMRAGYHVEAAFMKNWSSTEGLLRSECPWLEDRRVALQVAAHLGIPFHTFDFEKEYSKNVMEYFFKEYKAGRTPNPDVMCNKEIKFKLLYQKAMDMGFDYLATGHYAQILGKKSQASERGAGLYQLTRSVDEFKDQTYFIYNIKKEQLSYLMFPVGKYKKSEVRKLAKKFGLPNADRKESMGLCFVGKIELKKFLEQRIKDNPGDIIDLEGNVVGKHKGVAFYTLGQREGLNTSTGPWYVVAKDLKKNKLIVTHNPNQKEYLMEEVQITNLNWLSDEKFPLRCKARFRHQQPLQNVTVAKSGKDIYTVRFKSKQRAVASGQSLVLYKGKVCLGGGVIV